MAQLSSPGKIVIGSDRSLYILDGTNYRIRRVATAQPGVGTDAYPISATNGSQLFHFNAKGRHLGSLTDDLNRVKGP